MTPRRPFDFFPLAIQSLTQPRLGLRTVLGIPANLTDTINAAWLVIVINLLLSVAFSLFGLVPAPEGTEATPLSTSALLAAFSMFGGAVLVHRVGGLFGGIATFETSLKMVVWTNFVLLVVQLPMPFLAGVGPDALMLGMFLVMIVAMVQITAQVMEIHGFTEVFPVLIGVFLSLLALGIVALTFLAATGAQIPT